MSRQAAHGKHLRPGRAASSRVEDMALEASARLERRYDALKGAGKRASTAKVAVVGELVRWMWAMGLRHCPYRRESCCGPGSPGSRESVNGSH